MIIVKRETFICDKNYKIMDINIIILFVLFDFIYFLVCFYLLFLDFIIIVKLYLFC